MKIIITVLFLSFPTMAAEILNEASTKDLMLLTTLSSVTFKVAQAAHINSMSSEFLPRDMSTNVVSTFTGDIAVESALNSLSQLQQHSIAESEFLARKLKMGYREYALSDITFALVKIFNTTIRQSFYDSFFYATSGQQLRRHVETRVKFHYSCDCIDEEVLLFRVIESWIFVLENFDNIVAVIKNNSHWQTFGKNDADSNHESWDELLTELDINNGDRCCTPLWEAFKAAITNIREGNAIAWNEWRNHLLIELQKLLATKMRREK